MFEGVKGFFAHELSIDLGTANTVIYDSELGIVLNEPSVVAIATKDGYSHQEVVAVGTKAKTMLGRTPKNVVAIRPLKDGVIADFNATEKMLQYFIHKVSKNSFYNFARRKPKVLICVPCGATQVERRAIKESALRAGARAVYLIEEPMAAALGAGIQIQDANGSMVLDIGGGTSELAILSLSGIVYSASIRVGGDRLDESIINYVKRKYATLIGESTAEKLKQKIGTAFVKQEVKKMSIRGRHLTEGVPRTFFLTSREVCEALQEPLQLIIDGIRVALETAPPELSADIGENGIHLTGGGALLDGIDALIQAKIGIPVVLPAEPLTCVVRGGAKALEYMRSTKLDSIFID